MRIYWVSCGTHRDSYYTSKSEALSASNWEYHKRMDLYGSNQWYRQPVFSAKVSLSKEGIISALNDCLEWEIVREGGWMEK